MQNLLQSARQNEESPKLLNQVRGKIRLKHYNIRTEQAYLEWIKRFILHFDKRLKSSVRVRSRALCRMNLKSITS